MKSITNIQTIQKGFQPTGQLVRSWLLWALGFLVVVSLMGLALRYFFIGEIPGFSFNNIKHGHSHAAMLGWAFMGASGLLIHFFIENSRKLSQYKWAMILNILAVTGMIISFPLEGYGAWSISFSTLHVLSAYWFSFLFLVDLKHSDRGSLAKSFARWSVLWMLISTIGLWAIAPVGILLGGLHPLYFMSIQWFLHFQLIGWFTYSVIAGLIAFSEDKGLTISIPDGVFPGIQLSVILTYALSVNWSTPSNALFYLNTGGVVIQLIAFYILLKPVFKFIFRDHRFRHFGVGLLLKAGLITLVIRILIQTLVVVPEVAEISYTLRMYVIAFVHLIMLGTFTLTLGGLLSAAGVLRSNNFSLTGWLGFLLAFAATEILLFGQGTMLWAGLGFISGFHHIVFGFSLLFPVAAAFLWLGQFRFSNIFNYTTNFSINKNLIL